MRMLMRSRVSLVLGTLVVALLLCLGNPPPFPGDLIVQAMKEQLDEKTNVEKEEEGGAHDEATSSRVLLVQTLVNPLVQGPHDKILQDATLTTLYQMDLDKPYHAQVKRLFVEHTDIHRAVLSYIENASDPGKMFTAIRLLEQLASTNEYNAEDNDDGAFSWKLYISNVQQILAYKLANTNLRGQGNLSLLIAHAFAALGQVFEQLVRAGKREDSNCRYMGLFVEKFVLPQLKVFHDHDEDQECVYQILKCLYWRVVYSGPCLLHWHELVQETDLMNLLLSIVRRRHHQSTSSSSKFEAVENRITLQVLEIWFHLLQTGEALHQVDQGNRKPRYIPNEVARQLSQTSDGWLLIAIIKDDYKSLATPGCNDHYRYRYELAETLYSNLLLLAPMLSLDDSATTRVDLKAVFKEPAPTVKIGFCRRFSSFSPDMELHYEPMGRDGPFEINSDSTKASTYVDCPFQLLTRTMLTSPDAALSVIKGLHLNENHKLRKQFHQTFIANQLAGIIGRINSLQRLHDAIVVVEELAGPATDGSFGLELYEAGTARAILSTLDQETIMSSHAYPILVHGLVAIANILVCIQQSELDGDFQPDSNFLTETMYSLHRFLHLYEDCESCVFSSMYCLDVMFQFTANIPMVRSLATKTDLVEKVLDLAVRYLETTSKQIGRQRTSTMALQLIARLLTPTDVATEEARSVLQSSSRAWLQIILIHLGAKTAKPPRTYEATVACAILSNLFPWFDGVHQCITPVTDSSNGFDISPLP